MFDFKEQFKSSETIVLLRMLETPEKFQPEAVAAAKEIIENRRNEDSKVFEDATILLSKEKEPVNTPKHPIADEGMDIWEENETERLKKRITNNRIIAICVAFIGVNILFIYPKINLILRFINYTQLPEGLTQIAIIIAPLLFSAAGIVFFYKKEKTGWILLVFDFTYRLVFAIGLLIISIRFTIFSTLNIYNLPFSIYSIILPLVLYSIMLYQMGSSRIMSIYKASNKTLLYTMVSSFIAAATYIYIVNLG